MSLVWAGLAWLSGLALASSLPLELWQWSLLAACAAASTISFRKLPRFRTLFTLVCLLFLAAARWAGANLRIDPEQVAFYVDTPQTIQITGQISSDPQVFDNQTRLKLKTERIWIPDLGIQRSIQGSILVISSPLRSYQYGQRLRVTGYLETPPESGDFSYRAYLARQDILAWIPEPEIRSLGMGRANPLLKVLYLLRRNALEQVGRLFPYPEAPLIAGILLGIENYIPDDLSDAYRSTGTTHIIAISGFNITIIAGLAIALFGRIFGRVRGLYIAGVFIATYTIFVGGDAPVIRAAIMGVLALVARYLGRRTHGLTSLAAAAVLMTLVEPRSILDVGFQLSFFATLGLILYAEPLSRLAVKFIQIAGPNLNAKRWGGLTAEVLLFTFAAQITTMPIIAWHFNQISLTSLVTNALILPLQPLLMILSGLATILGLAWYPLGQLAAWFAWPFSALTNRLVTLLAAMPRGVIYVGKIRPAYLLAYYLGLFLITLLLSTPWRDRLTERLQPIRAIPRIIPLSAVIMLLSLSNLIVWHTFHLRPDGRLHVIIQNVGRGESILIRTPSGGTLLANGGASPVKLGTELGRHLPYPDRWIDWLIVAGTDYVQIAGLREITAMAHVGRVLTSSSGSGTAYRRVFDQIIAAEIPIDQAEAGQQLDLGAGATLEVIAEGAKGITLLLEHGNARILLPLGLSPAEIPVLLNHQRTGDLSAVLLADGGYQAVNPDRLIAHFNPMVMMISCQTGECPDPTIPTSRLSPGVILSTNLHGSIALITDGERLWITTERSPGVDGNSTRTAYDSTP